MPSIKKVGPEICENRAMSAPATDTAEAIASLILKGFDDYRRAFRRITSGALARFESADWRGVQRASMERIELYRRATDQIFERIGEEYGGTATETALWQEIKDAYISLIQHRKDCELAETVFNTIFRKTVGAAHLGDDYAFVTEPLPGQGRSGATLARRFGPSSDLRGLLQEILESRPFRLSWMDMETDIELMVSTMKESIPLLRTPDAITFEVLDSIFFRNKGAYLIGRMTIGEHDFPIAIPIHNTGESLYVDTIIWNEDELSIIFSFTRSYFMVDIDSPRDMVHFLADLLPNKKVWEIYTSLGFYKHGKTEFYRGFLEHLDESDDEFVIAEGIKGLVMAVFTLPSYQVVFKVIRDKFGPSKQVTREQVREAYYLVKTHDRVGRMADTQEFHNFRFPRWRFSQAVLDELSTACGSSLTLTDDEVIISHLYTERLMTPLNIYIQHASNFELRQVLDEYGNAIKQLAAANIFPGDMLPKNFGVTRHRRVVFYDYDEICYLTQINFREIPKPADNEHAMAAEPWYEVGPWDVFPEEFRNFLFTADEMLEIFDENHADLFTVAFWQDMQEKIRNEQVVDVYPYRRKRSFRRGVSSFGSWEKRSG